MNNTGEDKFSDPELDLLQLSLAKQLNFDVARLYQPKEGDIFYCIDVLYKDGVAVAGCDIMAWPSTHIETIPIKTTAGGKYIPGYFAFYEGPVIVHTVNEATKKFPAPDLIITDGHGLAHPRKFGLACYVGVQLGLPVMGIAKQTLLPVNYAVLGAEKGSALPVLLNEEIAGLVLRTQHNIKPMFISAGNMINLDTVKEITLALVNEYRIPDPLRRADFYSRQ